jgi:Domain of unknown function (DUF5060)/Protein of unknown function (DUF4038)/Domain of unknown function (DUF5605)
MKFPPVVRLVLLLIAAFASLGVAKDLEQWGIYEVALKGPSDGNPFVDVQLSAIFTDGTHTHEVEGFYDGDGLYRVRFMPETPGQWRYETKSNRQPLAGKKGTFAVSPASPKNHGPVQVRNTYHFGYADGTPFRQIGTTVYGLAHQEEALQEETFETLATAPFNKVRLCVLPTKKPARELVSFPFEGKLPREWDASRFNPRFFQNLEKCVGQLRDLGIEADVILFHPYGGQWGFDKMDPAAEDRYLRYVVARLAAYRNVWWSISNEYDFVRTKTDADWTRFFQVVQKSDPYGRLRSIHNGFKLYDNTKPWVTHASIQNGAAVQDPTTAQIYRDVWNKPVVYDEVKYEGRPDFGSRWGRLSGQEMLHRFWSGVIGGTYVGHGETLKNSSGKAWLGSGGTLAGESPARLAFLRKVMEDGPKGGIEPIDKWQHTNMGGQPGDYYLLYFGKETPKSWTFWLPRNAIKEGMTFEVEILDTWDMTVTPVEGKFVTRKGKDKYYFRDEKDREIALPGKPGIALRITRVSGEKAAEELPDE